MSKMNSVSAKGFCGHALARTIAVFFLVTFAFAAALVFAASTAPQQAFADTSLRAGSTDLSTDESISTQGITRTMDGFHYSHWNPYENASGLEGFFALPDSGTYCDQAVCIEISLDYMVVGRDTPIDIVGVSDDATYLVIPELVHFDDNIQEAILTTLTSLYLDWKNGDYPSAEDDADVQTILNFWLEAGWDTSAADGSQLRLKDLSEGFPLYYVMGESPQSLQSISFEETDKSKSMEPLIINRFSDCTNLTSITLPTKRNVMLVYKCFKNTSITSITLPSTVTCWMPWVNAEKNGPFEACQNLQSADLSQYNGKVAKGLFNSCPNLSSVTFGPNVTAIGEYAFQGCTSLESVVLPDSLTTIDNDAFQGCTSLRSISWPNNAAFRVVDGFDGCTALGASVVSSLPASVVSIGSSPSVDDLNDKVTTGAFSNCSFTALSIPSQITNIGAYAFSGCAGLNGATIDIPYSVHTMGQKAFSISAPESAQAASITLRFQNPDFMFTQLESAASGDSLITEYQSGYEGGLFFHPFGNTQVTFEASAIGSNGETSPLKQAYDTYYVRENEADSYASGELMSSRVLSDGSSRQEYQFTASGVAGASHWVTGTVPEGATVLVTRAGTPVAVTQSGTTFSSQVVEGADVAVCVSLPGYRDLSFEKNAAAFTQDWHACELTTSSFTEATGVAPTGVITKYSRAEVVPGSAFTAKIAYELPDGATSGLIAVSLPKGARFYSASNENSKLGASVSIEDGVSTVSIPVTHATGNVFFQMSLPSGGEYTLAGSIMSDGVEGQLEPLSIDCRKVHIVDCPDVVGKIQGNKMTVSTLPGESVVVKSNGVVVGGPVQANAVGTAHVEFSLPENAATNGEYELVAEADGGSDSHTVQYRLFAGSVKSFTMSSGQLSGDAKLVVDGEAVDIVWQIASPPTFTLDNAYWKFALTFISNEPLNSDISVLAYSAKGAHMLSSAFTIVSEKQTAGGQYEYELAASAIDLTLLDAIQKKALGQNYDYTWRIPDTIVLTDGKGMYVNMRFAFTGIVDPSGTVFEAVPSNVLSGVTATIRLADDALGTNARNWTEAPAYDQATSIVTGTDGAYAWDVPEGWWQVAFSKEGYEAASTEWMEVQPPRLGLQTGLVSKASPTVKYANAYGNAIEIEFSQYMKTGKVAASDEYSGISVTIDGEAVPANGLLWVNCEESLSKELLSRTLRVNVPEDSPYSGTVAVQVSGARNYAGNAMAAAYADTLTVVGQKPASFVVANARQSDVSGQYSSAVIAASGMVGQATIYAGSDSGTPVAITLFDDAGHPVAGAVLRVSVDSGSGVSVASGDDALSTPALTVAANETDVVTVTTNGSGVATVNMFGTIPGISKMSVAVDGSPLAGEALVVTSADERPASDNPGNTDNPSGGDNPSGSDDPSQGGDPSGSGGSEQGDNPGGSDDPSQGDNPGGSDNPSQGDNPSGSDDSNGGDSDNGGGTSSEKATDPEQNKGSEQGSNTDTTDTTTKATSTTTNTAVAAKGSAPATDDMTLTFVINALSVVALTAFLLIAFRRRA